MKKWISLLLAVLLAFSCCSTAFAATTTAPEEETTKKPLSETLAEMIGTDFTEALTHPDLSSKLPSDYTDAATKEEFDTLMQSGAFRGVDFMGLDLDFMYNSTGPLIWSTLSISRSDLALIYGNLDTYLMRILKDKIKNFKFYTSANATKIANFIGHLYDPNFTDISITLDADPTTSEIFYTTIANRSGLSDWLEEAWCHSPVKLNYVALITTLGVELNDFLVPTQDIYVGAKIAPLLIKSFIEKAALIGPFANLLAIIRTFVLTYDYYLYSSVEAFFKKYIDAGKITTTELKTFRGLLNICANGNDSSKTERLQFITPPAYRFAITTDETEMFLYLLVYCNLIGAYKTNATAVKAIKNAINNCSKLDATQKERLVAIAAVFFESKFAEFEPVLTQLSMENIAAVPTNIKDKLFGFFGRIIDSITNIFDTLFKALKKFL